MWGLLGVEGLGGQERKEAETPWVELGVAATLTEHGHSCETQGVRGRRCWNVLDEFAARVEKIKRPVISI